MEVVVILVTLNLIITLVNVALTVAVAGSLVRLTKTRNDRRSMKAMSITSRRRVLNPDDAPERPGNWDGMPRDVKNWDGMPKEE